MRNIFLYRQKPTFTFITVDKATIRLKNVNREWIE